MTIYMLSSIFVILVVFQAKHLVCDYFLQNEYMLGKFNKRDWVSPLSAHCLVQALGTFIIALFYAPSIAFALACVDFIIHFIVDKGKVEFSRGMDSKKDPEFWWLLGIDQFLHHVTGYVIIMFLLGSHFKLA